MRVVYVPDAGNLKRTESSRPERIKKTPDSSASNFLGACKGACNSSSRPRIISSQRVFRNTSLWAKEQSKRAAAGERAEKAQGQTSRHRGDGGNYLASVAAATR